MITTTCHRTVFSSYEIFPSIFMGTLDCQILVYYQTQTAQLNELMGINANWLQFKGYIHFEHPYLSFPLSLFSPNDLNRLQMDEIGWRQIMSIIERIKMRLDTGANDIFGPTLCYLLLKAKYLGIKNQFQTKWKGKSASKIVDLLNYLERDIEKERRLKYYADKLFISGNYLSEWCKNELKLSFKKLNNIIITLKILDAFILTSKNFSMISLELGFSDQAHFSHFFRKQLSVSPSEFRNGLRI